MGSDKADHDDYFGSSNSTCSSIHGDDFGVLDCTDASNILDPKEDEPLLSPDDKAYGYGHDGFPYGYSDAINIGTDSFYGLAPGSSEELGMWKCGQTHFRQDPYQGHASVGYQWGTHQKEFQEEVEMIVSVTLAVDNIVLIFSALELPTPWHTNQQWLSSNDKNPHKTSTTVHNVKNLPSPKMSQDNKTR